MKKTIKLTESDLNRIVSESVKHILTEDLTQNVAKAIQTLDLLSGQLAANWQEEGADFAGTVMGIKQCSDFLYDYYTQGNPYRTR